MRHEAKAAQSRFGVAVDIGTTTVALELVDLPMGRAVARTGFANRQAFFGADVMSRIKASIEGSAGLLRDIITQDLASAVGSLLGRSGVTEIGEMVVAANNAMVRMLLGLPCDSLAAWPYAPGLKPPDNLTFSGLTGASFADCPVRLVGGLSSFVGGDITAGLVSLGGGGGKSFLLLDAGTNAEMALYAGGRLFCASAAAGPVFEGASLSSGMPGTEGAICSVGLSGGGFAVETIGAAPPAGICGSGALDAMACLLEGDYADGTGLLSDAYFDSGVVLAFRPDKTPVSVTQKDIRELQLAKAAIRAGLEILMDEAGVTPGDLDSVYLSGALGSAIRPKSAAAVGLLPAALAEKARGIGNSALSGAVALLLEPGLWDEQNRLACLAEEVSLPMNERFQELFLKHICF